VLTDWECAGCRVTETVEIDVLELAQATEHTLSWRVDCAEMGSVPGCCTKTTLAAGAQVLKG
jgi:hypothetical protein